MTTPNYQYCLGFCSGKMKMCGNYERANILGVCKHYRLIHNYTRTIRTLHKKDIEKLLELARIGGGINEYID